MGQLLLPHIGEAMLFPEDTFRDYQRPDVPQTDHYHQWVDACLGKGQASMNFDLAGPLTEALLLGVVANRFPGQQLQWNAKALEITNCLPANDLLARDYRDGFQVSALERAVAGAR